MLQLRVLWPEEEVLERPTLDTVWEDLRRQKVYWDSRTAQEYESTVRIWTQTMGDPPLTEIDQMALCRFGAQLKQRPGRQNGNSLSANTIRKHFRQLRALLKLCSRNGWIEQVPEVEMPKPVRRIVQTWTLEELAKLRGAARKMSPSDLTRPIPSPLWWESLIILLHNTGWRIGTMLASQWAWINGDWIIVPPEALKGKDRGRRWYLNRWARERLTLLARYSRGEGPILPWRGSITTFHRHRRRLQTLAGLPVGMEWGAHCFRRTTLTLVAKINPLVARIIAGHASGDVLAEHYIADELIAEVMEQLQQP